MEDGLVTYPGLPAPIVCDYLSREASRAHYAEGTTFQIARIELVANTGTYVDAPFHRFAEGADLAALLRGPPISHWRRRDGAARRRRGLRRHRLAQY